jgi:hypothetical protein
MSSQANTKTRVSNGFAKSKLPNAAWILLKSTERRAVRLEKYCSGGFQSADGFAKSKLPNAEWILLKSTKRRAIRLEIYCSGGFQSAGNDVLVEDGEP